MAKLVSQIEPASSWFERTVDDRYAKIPHGHIRGIATPLAKVERERKQTGALGASLKAEERPGRNAEPSPQLRGGILGGRNAQRRIQCNPRDLREFAFVEQKVNVPSDPLNPRVERPRPPADSWI